jgi:endonuclease/exonuclease/phosphatase family metal-dependent hydrolase
MKHKQLAALLACIFLCLPTQCAAQSTFRVMSYNVENLFDTEDDPLADDEEFLPESKRKWTPERYRHKLLQIGKAISVAGEWDTPALAGLCEVENDSVLTHLLTRTALRSCHYRYCISGRSDRRGIRVALLYRYDRFQLIGQRSIHVPVRGRPTRDLLHVWGSIAGGDTLDVVVCHLPSKAGRSGGDENRMRVASALRGLCDSLAACRMSPLIIAMGDFNDTPGSECLNVVAGGVLCNLFAASESGSYKYRSQWEQIDHIFIHCGMKSDNVSLKYVERSARTLDFPFLFTGSRSKSGKRPFRTFSGNDYEGGFSDHLPIVADFTLDR